MPAVRKQNRRNWPTGLYQNIVDGVVYYRYRDPIRKKMVSFGSDFDAALKAARARNQEIVTDPVERLIEKARGASALAVPFGTAADAWLLSQQTKTKGRGIELKPLSTKTLDDYESYVRRFKATFGEKSLIKIIDLRTVSDYLASLKDQPTSRNTGRKLLIRIWAHAVASGWVQQNVAEQTQPVDHGVMRDRLRVGQFDAIISHPTAPAWLSAACRLALYADQRLSDVTTLKTTAWDGHLLTVDQGKTGHVVKITAGPLLARAIADCLASGPESPYVVRKVDEVTRKKGFAGRVTGEMLTKEFSSIRDRLIREGHRDWIHYSGTKYVAPTFHEIRSLGTALSDETKKSGSIAGHATEEMRDLYLRGHRRVFEADSL